MNNNGGGPCGACKFLRRKCVKNCVFAPYFDSDDQSTTHFAAVHRVFGASNASKLLLRVPLHRRLDAVVSLCYEALSRVRDPVYGCVADIITLQQQIVSLQTELACVRARFSMMQCLPQPNLSSIDGFLSRKLTFDSSSYSVNSDSTKMEQMSLVIPRSPNISTPTSQELEESDLEMLSREFLAKYVPDVMD